jgi:phosphoglycolate phosphatase-like HAD superfamily hydrolase
MDGLELVLAFDMDGVLFDTEGVKLGAFRDAFAPLCRDDAQLEQIGGYNAAHRGVPRGEKIRHLLTAVLGESVDLEAEVSARYARLLEERLRACGPVGGVPEFLARVAAIRYVVSSAPEGEIRSNLRRHGLSDAFREVYGHPWSKVSALRDLVERHRGARVLFFGDAPVDRDAAAAAGVAFAAVNPNAALAATVCEFFDDFSALDRARIDLLVDAAG